MKLSLPHKRHQPSSILPTISPRVEGVRIQDFFSVPTEHKGVSGCECKKFKQIQVQQVGFECPHHLWVSPPLNLQSQNDKITFIGCHHLSKFWGKKTNVKWQISIFYDIYEIQLETIHIIINKITRDMSFQWQNDPYKISVNFCLHTMHSIQKNDSFIFVIYALIKKCHVK